LAGVHGIDPMAFLASPPTERLIQEAVINCAEELRLKHNEDLAAALAGVIPS
jgi:hypothetical protein